MHNDNLGFKILMNKNSNHEEIQMKNMIASLTLVIALLGASALQAKDAKPNPKETAMELEFRKFGDKYIIRVNSGQNLVKSLQSFCENKKIHLATISGLGSLKSVTLGFFNPESKKYQQKTFNEPLEMASLVGNVVEKDGKPLMHLHTTVAGDNYKALAGHMVDAEVSLTAEIIIEPIDGIVFKKFDEKTGLNLFNFGEPQTPPAPQKNK